MFILQGVLWISYTLHLFKTILCKKMQMTHTFLWNEDRLFIDCSFKCFTVTGLQCIHDKDLNHEVTWLSILYMQCSSLCMFTMCEKFSPGFVLNMLQTLDTVVSSLTDATKVLENKWELLQGYWFGVRAFYLQHTCLCRAKWPPRDGLHYLCGSYIVVSSKISRTRPITVLGEE